MLEHLQPHEAEQAVENFCAHADDVVFSSTPFDYKEASHFNVQPPEYWAELFARHGFYRDLDYDASYMTRWATRFRKAKKPATRIVVGLRAEALAPDPGEPRRPRVADGAPGRPDPLRDGPGRGPVGIAPWRPSFASWKRRSPRG